MEKSVQWSLSAAIWVLVLGALFLGWKAIHRACPSGDFTDEPAGSGRYICPVDRIAGTLAPDTPTVNYQGKDFHFCQRRDERGRDHKTLFLMDPELYLTGVSSFQGANLSAPKAPEAAP